MRPASNGECSPDHRIQVRLATGEDRTAIYRIRHLVYAQELRQHLENESGQLTDALDDRNLYIVAAIGGRVAGFISVTPPGGPYSIDKYLARDELPFPCDEDRLYEVRLLTLLPAYRHSAVGTELSGLLIYAAFRWVEGQGGGRIVGIGRREVLGLCRKIGLEPLGRQIQSGAVVFELMTGTLDALRQRLSRYTALIEYAEPDVDWRLAVPFSPVASCFHGGAFFGAIGDEFDHLQRGQDIINADVLDAWFAPAPSVVAALQENLAWLARTSPPTTGAGLVRAICRARGLDAECVLPGAGSSDLIFRAFRQWLRPDSRVLLLDPTYGEYAHVCEEVVGCSVDRFALLRENGYAVDVDTLVDRLRRGDHDLAVLVNPNNPTGRHIDRQTLETALRRVPSRMRVWVDEAYIDYVGAEQSLERFAARTPNVVVCKSMSKAYALSGMRVGYLCGAAALIEELRLHTPPWVVGLAAQVAAVRALESPDYYAECYQATHALRDQLTAGLAAIDRRLQVIPGSANFVLCHLPAEGPDALTVASHCQARGLFLRVAGRVGEHLGRHAIRIAIKGEEVQRRMLEILTQVLRSAGRRDAAPHTGCIVASAQGGRCSGVTAQLHEGRNNGVACDDRRVTLILRGSAGGNLGEVERVGRVARRLVMQREVSRNFSRQRSMNMAVKPVPEGYHTATPYLIVQGGAKALDFYKKAFGAKELMRSPGPGDRIMHAEIQIGDSIIMLGDENPQMGLRGPKSIGGSPVGIMLYVPDVDARFSQVVAAGAKVKQPVKDQFYGDRSGTIEDPFGHVWTISTHKEDVPPEEMKKRAEAAMKQQGAG
jgi:histidinol-phosphate/aromatic aminotransferase/cobyric acid decarboxylase-like protein/uncharacterized glyoxalase superfamily protein PhnB